MSRLIVLQWRRLRLGLKLILQGFDVFFSSKNGIQSPQAELNETTRSGLGAGSEDGLGVRLLNGLLPAWLAGWMASWLAGCRLAGRLISRRAAWLAGRLARWQAGSLARLTGWGRLAGCLAGWLTETSRLTLTKEI